MIQAIDGTKISVQPITDKSHKNKSLTELLRQETNQPMAYLIYPDELPWDQPIGRNEVLFGTMFSSLDYRLTQAADVAGHIPNVTALMLAEQEACDLHEIQAGNMDPLDASMHAFSYDDSGVSMLCQYRDQHFKVPVCLNPEDLELVRQIIQHLD